MQKIKTFIYILFKSLTSLEYYQDILNVDVKFSLRYYVILVILMSILSSFGITYQLAPGVKTETRDFIDQITQIYPSDLEVKVTSGTLSINKPEPYFIKAPAALNSIQEDNLENTIVFDSNGTIDDLDNYNTFVVINNKNLLIKDETKTKAYPLSNLPDGTFTKDSIINLGENVKKWTNVIPVVMFLILLGLYLTYFIIVRTLYLFIVAGFLVLIVNVNPKLKIMSLGMGKLYQIGLHVITLPLIIETLATILGVQIPIPLWFFTLNIVLGILVINSFEKGKKFN